MHALPHLEAWVLLQVLMLLGVHGGHEVVGAAGACPGRVEGLSSVLLCHGPAGKSAGSRTHGVHGTMG